MRSVKEMLHIFNHLMKSILKLNRWNEKFEFYIDQERDRFIGKYKILARNAYKKSQFIGYLKGHLCIPFFYCYILIYDFSGFEMSIKCLKRQSLIQFEDQSIIICFIT